MLDFRSFGPDNVATSDSMDKNSLDLNVNMDIQYRNVGMKCRENDDCTMKRSSGLHAVIPTNDDIIGAKNSWQKFSPVANDGNQNRIPRNSIQNSNQTTNRMYVAEQRENDDVKANTTTTLAISSNRVGIVMEPRACSRCGTTRTPLWRNGPDGPKTLCNACGVRENRLANKRHQQTTGLKRHVGNEKGINKKNKDTILIKKRKKVATSCSITKQISINAQQMQTTSSIVAVKLDNESSCKESDRVSVIAKTNARKNISRCSRMHSDLNLESDIMKLSPAELAIAASKRARTSGLNNKKRLFELENVKAPWVSHVFEYLVANAEENPHDSPSSIVLRLEQERKEQENSFLDYKKHSLKVSLLWTFEDRCLRERNALITIIKEEETHVEPFHVQICTHAYVHRTVKPTSLVGRFCWNRSSATFIYPIDPYLSIELESRDCCINFRNLYEAAANNNKKVINSHSEKKIIEIPDVRIVADYEDLTEDIPFALPDDYIKSHSHSMMSKQVCPYYELTEEDKSWLRSLNKSLSKMHDSKVSDCDVCWRVLSERKMEHVFDAFEEGSATIGKPIDAACASLLCQKDEFSRPAPLVAAALYFRWRCVRQNAEKNGEKSLVSSFYRTPPLTDYRPDVRKGTIWNLCVSDLVGGELKRRKGLFCANGHRKKVGRKPGRRKGKTNKLGSLRSHETVKVEAQNGSLSVANSDTVLSKLDTFSIAKHKRQIPPALDIANVGDTLFLPELLSGTRSSEDTLIKESGDLIFVPSSVSPVLTSDTCLQPLQNDFDVREIDLVMPQKTTYVKCTNSANQSGLESTSQLHDCNGFTDDVTWAAIGEITNVLDDAILASLDDDSRRRQTTQIREVACTA